MLMMKERPIAFRTIEGWARSALLEAGASPAVGRRLGVAYLPPGRHQPANELGSLGLIERGVRHAPEPAADNEVATVRRYMMLHDNL
jgi:S-formylglutathione hydrolase FrmB